MARRNFGCGSSREHAPWALDDYGFRVVIAPSFADIFYNNCFKNGMLPITLSEADVDELFRRAAGGQYHLTVDLESQTADRSGRIETRVRRRPGRKHCLLHGLDDIGLTLAHEDRITAYEKRRGLAPVSA